MTGPLALSVQVALAATFLALAAGLPLASWLAHRRGPAVLAIDTILAIPLVLPPTVVGYALLEGLGRKSTLGALYEQATGSPLVFTPAAAVVAATVSAFPLVVRSARTAFEEVERSAIEASRTLGAGRLATFWRIKLPLSARGIALGASLGFSRALGDFGATLLFAGGVPGSTRTASIALYDAVQTGRGDEATSLVAALVALAVVPVVVTNVLVGRATDRARH